MYSNYQPLIEAAAKNWELLVTLFGDSKQFKLMRPMGSHVNHVEDGILTCKKDGKDVVILVEVKLRGFSSDTLRNDYNSVLFLEKSKYKHLHEKAKKIGKGPNRIMKIWYLSMTTDGCVFIHNITDGDYTWLPLKMNNVTYAADQVKKEKKVALLHCSDAIYAKKINLK